MQAASRAFQCGGGDEKWQWKLIQPHRAVLRASQNQFQTHLCTWNDGRAAWMFPLKLEAKPVTNEVLLKNVRSRLLAKQCGRLNLKASIINQFKNNSEQWSELAIIVSFYKVPGNCYCCTYAVVQNCFEEHVERGVVNHYVICAIELKLITFSWIEIIALRLNHSLSSFVCSSITVWSS